MKLYLSKAEGSDLPELCRIFKDIYRGNDYLPFAFQAWVDEENEWPERRRNLFLKDEDQNGRILGFTSFMFQVSTSNDSSIYLEPVKLTSLLCRKAVPMFCFYVKKKIPTPPSSQCKGKIRLPNAIFCTEGI